MNIIVRPPEAGDAEAINAIRFYEDEWIMARYRPEFMKGRGSDERQES